MLVVADTRERSVISFLEDEIIQTDGIIDLNVEQIAIGDYVICENSKIVVCIERKTYSDFAASLYGNRWENKEKMIKYREETGCKLVYVIEGNTIDNDQITAAIYHLMFRDDIHVIYTQNTKDTAKTIVKIAKTLITIAGKREIEEAHKDVTGEQMAELKKIHVKTTKEEAMYCLSRLPRVSNLSAEVILEKYSAYELITMPDIDFSEFTYKSGGKFRSNTISSLTSLRDGDIDICADYISGMSGISKPVATKLVTEISINKMTNTVIISGINTGSGSRKVKFGEKRAQKVIDTLNYKM